MSYVSTYANKPPDAKGIGIAIGVHALIVAAVLAMPGIDLPGPPPNVVEFYNVKPEPVPVDPVPEPDKPVIDIPQPTPGPTDIAPLVERPLPVDPVNSQYVDLGAEITAGNGLSDRLPVDILPTVPEPVIAQARLNSRYSAGFQPPYPPGLLRLETEGWSASGFWSALMAG